MEKGKSSPPPAVTEPEPASPPVQGPPTPAASAPRPGGKPVVIRPRRRSASTARDTTTAPETQPAPPPEPTPPAAQVEAAPEGEPEREVQLDARNRGLLGRPRGVDDLHLALQHVLEIGGQGDLLPPGEQAVFFLKIRNDEVSKKNTATPTTRKTAVCSVVGAFQGVRRISVDEKTGMRMVLA